MEVNVEEIEEKRNANMRAFLSTSLISLCSIILTLLVYFLELELDRQLAILIILIGVVIILVSFAFSRSHFAASLATGWTGFCIIMVVISFGEGQTFGPLFGLILVFIMSLALFLAMKFRFVEKSQEKLWEWQKETWEIDERGYIRKAKYPVPDPKPGELKNNIYGLWIWPGTSKDKLGTVNVMVFNARQRIPEHEKKLFPLIREVIEMEFDQETIERHGGMSKILSGIEWTQFWEG